jgi:hypothetical protein
MRFLLLRYRSCPREKAPALKPEAQAEGIRVCCTENPIPSARASGFLENGSARCYR